MTSLSQKIAWNTGAQVLGKIASATLGVIITVLLTNYLGPAGYGVYTAVTVFVLLFGSLADWGLSLITVREAAKNEAEAERIIGNVLVIRLALSFLAVIAVNLLVWFNPMVVGNLPQVSNLPYLVVITSFLLLAVSLKTSFQIIFNVKLQMQNSAISDLTSNVVVIGLIVWLMMAKAGLAEILWAFNIGQFAAAAIAAFLGYRLMKLDFQIIGQKAKFLLWESLPMGSILVLFTIYNRVDTVILAHFKTAADVGYYGLAYRVYEVLVLGAAFFANSVLPVLSNMAVSDRKKMTEIYNKSWVILIFMGSLVAVANFIFAPLVPIVFKGFNGSIIAVQILSLALIVSYLNHLNGFTIIALGKQWWSLLIAIVALGVNIVLNVAFIPHFSYAAAAFITFITEALIVGMSMVVIKREIGIGPGIGDVIDITNEVRNKLRGH